jgi:hypothetical protein
MGEVSSSSIVASFLLYFATNTQKGQAEAVMDMTNRIFFIHLRQNTLQACRIPAEIPFTGVRGGSFIHIIVAGTPVGTQPNGYTGFQQRRNRRNA